ncbi:hypothetical protein BDV93DRAFT_542618 [Ceratobasidium sp. AG-I]|nr:hypothetical protein BDV93DRAFT_542618 [Ceratobasidium sp. AG-I]
MDDPLGHVQFEDNLSHDLKPMERVPNEVLIHLFSVVTRRRDLAHVSLVCRRWNILAFADLYRTLYLGQQRHVDSIAQRIRSEFESGSSVSLHISHVLRRLIIDPARYEEDEEEEGEWSHFFSEQVISKLVHLEYLSWDAPRPPQPRTTLAFTEHCLQLRSVELKIRGFSLSEDADFNNRPGGPSALPKRLPYTVTNMIQASPNLRSLDLTCSTLFGWDATPWSKNPPSSNGFQVFRNLRIYRTDGSVDPNWLSFFEAPKTNDLRLFLQLHPRLHTVTIASKPPVQGYDSIDPETLAGLFPSLRHFEGPAFLCEALVQSSLAPFLKTLGISDEALIDSEVLCRIAMKAKHLSELQTLKYVLSRTISGDALPTMLAATPKLKHLFISHISLSQLSGDENLQLLLKPIKPLTAICPRLEYLYDCWPIGCRRCWRVVRKDGEVVKVDFDGFRRATRGYWEEY